MNSLAANVINPLTDERWNSFVLNHPYGSIYQHSSWLSVIAHSYRHIKPISFILESNSSDIHAAAPCCIVMSRLTGKRLVSLPFSSFSDPLTNDFEDFRRLFEELIKEMHRLSCDYFELRQFRNASVQDDERLCKYIQHKIHILEIGEGFENIRKKFHKDCIVRSVRKAEKAHVIIEPCESEEGLREFYYIHAVTRKRLGFPIQPYIFFKNMWNIMKQGNFITILLAKLRGKTIAGIVLFKFKDMVSFEHGASLQEYLHTRPNHLLIWRSIEMACSEGFRYFNFGKTTKNNKGLLDFKTRWGAQMFDIPYFYYPKIQGIMSLESGSIKHNFISNLERKMPLSIAKAISNIAYKHLG